jgi:ribose 5-phosphate isomerase RpiB
LRDKLTLKKPLAMFEPTSNESDEEHKMKIALMMENSQAAKNATVLNELQTVAQPLNHTVFNVGMSDEQDHHLTYIHLGIMASLLLNSKAVDFVVAGCGTGQGAMMSLNLHPGVVCGYCLDPSDAFLFNQVNNGNALALAFAKGYGWGAELNVRYIFEKAFVGERGQGYPIERREPQVRNAGILNEVKAAVTKDNYLDTLKSIDQELVKTAVTGERFQQAFFENCQVPEIADYVNALLK